MSQSSIVFNVAKDNLDVETVTNKLISIIDGWLKAKGAHTTDVQQQMLRSHVKAMVERAKTGESLPEVDVSLFEEISPESIALAEKVVNTLPGLAYEEAYLLSVHFEVARSNS
ncbi:transcriptional antiterminator [Arsenophonus endosymbiont of Aphis craccivora]|uniref:transcriptional antiterminator n=1 Tax=Arsenophonus endosymbiont of Aphis craccivora TaxID=1231049 RepID=UPI0015DD1FD7|nr:transcriptional antiterminator [Arsenophonus endosymbiont of Aphis craccivora]QLK87472.1 transcriptional antiterminator [Arsenophonus endosymbiont of Aphis craccivora]